MHTFVNKYCFCFHKRGKWSYKPIE